MLNKVMETKTKVKVSSRGGSRPGAGRKPGVKNSVTIADLLLAIDKSTGLPYVELLAQDFQQARANNDNGLVQKYHQLIMNKVSATLTSVEVSDNQDAVEAKKTAFTDALAAIQALTNVNKGSK